MISAIINTIAMDPNALERKSYNNSVYAARRYALRNFILPLYRKQPLGQLIVTGVWTPEPHDPYIVLIVTPEHQNVLDILPQRQAGFQIATGDYLLYQADDHIILDDMALIEPIMRTLDVDVLVPARWTRWTGIEAPANDGRQERYVPFHCAIYHRYVIERCPWMELMGEPMSLDVRHTEMMRKRGVRIAWTDEIRAWDVELQGAVCASS